jgi:pimeloyl-ACP methyl ester carboxylesterase
VNARWPRWLAGSALLGLGGCAMAMGWLYARQEKLLFEPEVLPATHRFSLDADVHEVGVDVPGARLSALHLQLPHPRGVVFFLHGNAGSLDNWFVDIDAYRRAHYDLFMLDYRGYGKSSGQIDSEAQLRADVRAAWDQIAPRYRNLRRVVYGRSIGSALAAELAADVNPELTVLVSPYSSMRALMREHYPLVPPPLLRYALDTGSAAARICGPLMLVHGEADALIAPAHSRAIQALAPQARLLLIPGAGHGDVHQFPAYQHAMAEALARH